MELMKSRHDSTLKLSFGPSGSLLSRTSTTSDPSATSTQFAVSDEYDDLCHTSTQSPPAQRVDRCQLPATSTQQFVAELREDLCQSSINFHLSEDFYVGNHKI